MLRAVLPSEFLCQAEAVCSAWQALSVPQTLHSGAGTDTQRGRSDLPLKSCHWYGSSGHRRIITLPLNHADKCWACLAGDWWPCGARHRSVENLSIAQRDWSDLSKMTHLFTHTGKHCENSCHLIQGLGIHYHPLLHIFSTDRGKKDVKYVKMYTICH